MKDPRRKFLHLAAGAVALSAMSRIAAAQTYPTRPIRLVIPFPPGGAFDALGRPWADRINPLLGTVVVENIGGGGAWLLSHSQFVRAFTSRKKRTRHCLCRAPFLLPFKV